MEKKYSIPEKLKQPTLFKLTELPPQHGVTHDYALPCSPRGVFESEAHLEETLLRDPNALKVFSELLGVGITAIARQVRTGRALAQRADLVALAANSKNPVKIIELMLPSLDGEHITRGVGYAIAARAKDLVLVAEAVPEAAANLIAALKYATDRLGITIHLVKLNTFVSSDGKNYSYSLRPLTPPRAPQPRQSFLEALAIRVAELGDDSLVNCTVSEGKRMDSYLGLGNVARIRIYSGHGNARISVIADSPRIHRRLLRKRLPERLKAHLAAYEPVMWSRDRRRVTASYGFTTDTSTTRATDLTLTRLAMAYIEIRTHLMSAVGDFTRAPAAKAPSIRYRKDPFAPQILPASLRRAI